MTTGAPFRIAVGRDEVAGVLHLPSSRPSACVIACHGMGASKDGEKYLELARECPPRGMALARFDFRGSGESGGRHGDATIASRIADLDAVLDYLSTRPELDGRFGLIGSSLGGFVALWTVAERRPGLPLVTWNAPADLRDVVVGDLSDPAGPGPALVAEVRAGRYAVAPAGVSRVLVVQSDRDEVVPLAHGRVIHDRCAEPRAIEVIAGGDHRLGDPRDRARALGESLAWLAQHLGEAEAGRPTGRLLAAAPGPGPATPRVGQSAQRLGVEPA